MYANTRLERNVDPTGNYYLPLANCLRVSLPSCSVTRLQVFTTDRPNPGPPSGKVWHQDSSLQCSTVSGTM